MSTAENSHGIVLRFENVCKQYGQFVAVQNLSFSVKAGEVLAFLGPNGAGKSTTLQCLLGLRHPTSGTIELFGGKPTDLQVRRNVGATPQDLDFPPQLKVKEVLDHVARAYEVALDPDLSEKLNLGKLLDRRSSGLSGGERRRLGLACALVPKPKLLILDEPTTGLDIESRRLLWEVIFSVHKQGTTILLTTHYLEEVENLADRVILIDHGQKMFEGSVEQIKSTVDYRKVQFSSDLLHLPAEITSESSEHRGDCWTLWTHNSDETVRALIAKGIPFKDLTVTGASLEEAVVQIRKRTAQ